MTTATQPANRNEMCHCEPVSGLVRNGGAFRTAPLFSAAGKDGCFEKKNRRNYQDKRKEFEEHGF